MVGGLGGNNLESFRDVFNLFDAIEARYADLDTTTSNTNTGNPFLNNGLGLLGNTNNQLANIGFDSAFNSANSLVTQALSDQNALSDINYLNLLNNQANNDADINRQVQADALNLDAKGLEGGILGQVNAEKKKNAQFYIAITKLDNTWARVKRAIQSMKW